MFIKFEIATAHGLINIINVPKPHKICCLTEEGKQVPFPILQDIYEGLFFVRIFYSFNNKLFIPPTAYVCFLRRCEEYFLCQFIPPPGINSVGEHINLESEMYLENDTDPKEKHIKQLIFNCLLKRETCISGCHNMNEIDLLELGSYTELQGGNIVLPSGYSSILGPICQQIPKESLIKAQPVKTIHWKRKKTCSGLETVDEDIEGDSDDSDKTVTEMPVGGQDTMVKVVTTDGNIYYADHVICTIPLGVLKEHGKLLFDPELPQYKLESIDRLLFGTVDKIFLEYDRPFLSVDISEVMLLWDQESDDSDESIEKNWFKKIYSFSKLSETLLLGWVSGREAEYMETLSHEAVADVCTGILRKFLKDPYVPKPKRCVW